MPDGHLPFLASDPRPLRVLYLDLNAYFASVEQAERPELRGLPVAVVPLIADTTFCIAASYEAKRFGVKTGTRVDEAKRLCPEVTIVEARPPLYVKYHEAVLAAVDTVLPVEKVCSIDEMRFRLIGAEREPAMARELALRLKHAIRRDVADSMSCSVGIAPNAFLAKLGTEIQKPDGLVVLQRDDLPERLHGLDLTGFTGINRKMQARLKASGVFTARDLTSRSPAELSRAFGSVVGERWWYLLRGYETELPTTSKHSLGHSHVLPPELRTDQGCREVLLRLAHKAAARLRAEGKFSRHMTVAVRGMKRSWSADTRLPPTQDAVTVTQHLLALWPSRDFEAPLSVGVTFSNLSDRAHVTPSLFDETFERAELSHAVDRMNHRFGKNSVYLASLERARDEAGEKIAFNKTWLFKEGKGDNAWPDPGEKE